MPQTLPNTSSNVRQPFHIPINSSSNNSVVTLQRAPSLTSSRSKSRGQPTPQSVQSQSYNGVIFDSHFVTPPDLRRLPKVEGASNLNRWSRSTSSSRETSSARQSSSRRMSLGGSGSFNFGTLESPEKPSPKRLQKNRPSTGTSPSRQTTRSSEPYSDSLLPPIVTLPSLQASVNTTGSPLTASPSTAGLLSAAVRSTVPDYFSKWDSTPRDFSQKKVLSAKSGSVSIDPPPSSEPIIPLNGPGRSGLGEGTVGGSGPRGHSRNRSGMGSEGTGSSRNSKQPSQKAMLSKALQKANTAVLLDNAQNFDGATQAYSEACSLLQQVMLRSAGDEDKRKLEAIVSF